MNKLLKHLLQTDDYKLLHKEQYPENTELIYSHVTPRGAKDPAYNEVVSFGAQRLLKKLVSDFDEHFFNLEEEEVDKFLKQFALMAGNTVDMPDYNIDHWKKLWVLGYLPINVNAIPEGEKIPFRIPLLTMYNTHKDFAWLINYLETLLLNNYWPAVTAATTSYTLRKVLQKWVDKTHSEDKGLEYRVVDFSLRGSAGMEAGEMIGLGHLVSFTASSNLQGLSAMNEYYGYQEDLFKSIPATEHSVMMVRGQDNELESVEALLDLYEGKAVSIVWDTWDYGKALSDILPRIKDKVLNREGKLVIRPDSGDRVEAVLSGLKILDQVFGTTTTKKGYKLLNPKVGIIFGEGISIKTADELMKAVTDAGYAASNLVLGIGSKLYGEMSRDTLGIAFKTSYAEVEGESRSVQKLATEFKTSPKGLLKITKDFELLQDVSWEEQKSEDNMLKPLMVEGKLTTDITLKEIKDKLWG